MRPMSLGFKGGGNNSTAFATKYSRTLTSMRGRVKANLLDKTLTLSGNRLTTMPKETSSWRISKWVLYLLCTDAGPGLLPRASSSRVCWTAVRHWSLNANVSFLNATYGVYGKFDSWNRACGLQETSKATNKPLPAGAAMWEFSIG